METVKKIGFSIVAFALPLLTKAATAAQPAPAGTGGSKANIPSTGIKTTQDVLNLLCIIFDWAFYFLIALAVIFGILAAYKYLTSNGDPEKVGEATKTLTYAAVGIVAALLASVIPTLVGNFFGTNLQACRASGGSREVVSSTFIPTP